MASGRDKPLSQKSESEKDRKFLGHPLGLLNIFATEFCERFSYYGMRAVLIFYLYSTAADGGLGLSQTEAMVMMSMFGSLVYLSSIMGGWIADRLLGPYRSIMYGCITIAAGHIVLGAPFGLTGVYIALLLIIIGTGLLKPNVSVMVGMLYSKDDSRRQAGFSLLYLSINIGAFLSPLIVGSISQSVSYSTAFMIPAAVMGGGLLIYLGLSRRTLAGIGRKPVQPLSVEDKRHWRKILIIAALIIIVVAALIVILDFISIHTVTHAIPLGCALVAVILFIFLIRDKNVSAEERNRMKAYIPLFIAATCFFSISEQQASTFAVVAKEYVNDAIFGFDIPPSWFSSVNPLGIIVLSPLFAIAWTKLGKRQISIFSKMGLGLIIAGAGLVIIAVGFFLNENNGGLLNPMWLIASITIITVGELFLSPTGLAATSLLAPENHISKVMGLWFISEALGQGINTITVQFFNGKAPETFFMIYAFAAFIIGVIVLILHKKLLALAGGIR
jgi:POT family proton-dependent oligopeptide transporter